MNEQTMNKLVKLLGNDTINLLNSMNAEELETVIVLAATEIETAKDELNANPKYNEIKENKAALEAGLKDLRKYNNARIKVAIALLQERGRPVAAKA